MAAKSFTLTTAAAATRLSDVYGGVAGAQPNPALDIPYRHIVVQAESADIKIGDATITTSNYGVLLANAAPAAPFSFGHFDTGPMKLSDFWAIGASGKLHIFAIPY
jgi:hypothetical protein